MIISYGGRRKARQPSLLLCVLLIVALIAQLSVAQRLTQAPDPDTTDAATTEEPATTAERTTTQRTSVRTTAESSAETTEASTTEASTTETTAESTTAETTEETTGFTATTESQTSTTTSNTESTTSSATSSKNLVPVVTVPPIGDAPYMQTSDTPEGTIFIAVGAALGFLGFAVLAWRGLVAWSVNRSVRRAALMHSSETKGLLRSKKKRSTAHGHSAMPPVSLEKLSGHKHGSYANQRSSKAPSSSSGLFFSPTAGQHSGGNRGSSYLPAGYYAAGGAAAGGSHSSMHFSSSDLPGLGPQSQGYVRTKSGPSPPGTPTYEHPQHNMSRHSFVGGSTSSVNLSSPPPQGRTPSAYLEDLFENHAPQQNQPPRDNRNNRR